MSDTEKISTVEKLKAQKAALDAKIKRAEAKERAQARKDETRRKVIVGAVILEHAELKPEFKTFLDDLLQRAVKRKIDREFLGLDGDDTAGTPNLTQEMHTSGSA